MPSIPSCVHFACIEIDEAVKRCFKEDDPAETIRLLQAENSKRPASARQLEFIDSTIVAMQSLNPTLLAAWYKLTREAAACKSLEESFELELQHCKDIRKS